MDGTRGGTASTGDARPAAGAATGRERFDWGEAWRGARAILPLLPGTPPFAFAFAIGSRAAGFSPLETVLMSLLVFAGSAQMAAISLTATGAGAIPILLTGLGLNLRHLLYGLSAASWLPRHRAVPLPVLASMLTDESYGVAARDAARGGGSAAFLFGASAIDYVTFGVSTVAGAILGAFLPDLSRLGLDVIFPLSFLALLVPLLRTRRAVAVAAVAAIGSLALGRALGSGLAILIAAAGAATLGAWLDRRSPPRRGAAV